MLFSGMGIDDDEENIGKRQVYLGVMASYRTCWGEGGVLCVGGGAS